LNHIIQILKIIVSLVSITKKQTNGTTSYQDRTYCLIPDMLVKIAHAARVHEGFCLLLRTLQHSLDPQTESILAALGHIAIYDNKLSFVVHHRVKALMRSEVYDVSVGFDDERIICCGCKCKAGGENKEKIICVHVLPVIYQISLLCYDGLADNIVVEIAHHWRRLAPQIENNETRTIIKKYLLVILSACQQNIPEDDNVTIEELLETFSVGTEKRRQIIRPPVSLDTLCPLRDLDMRSIQKRASDRLERRDINVSTSNIIESNDKIPINTIYTYQSICKYINLIKKCGKIVMQKYLILALDIILPKHVRHHNQSPNQVTRQDANVK
jgi:hypothetical protein